MGRERDSGISLGIDTGLWREIGAEGLVWGLILGYGKRAGQ